MLFWIKKVISTFLLPLPFGLICLFFGLLLCLTKQAKRTSTFLCIAGFCILFGFSFSPVTDLLYNHLQLRYQPLINVPLGVNKIVVLGSGLSGKKDYPPNLVLGSGSLSRLIEGIRVYNLALKNDPSTQLILSGGRVFQSPTTAGKMRNTALMLGVNSKNIVLEDGSTDTHDEAVFLEKTLGTAPFVLVTSAFHMPRAMQLFEARHMHPIPAPTQFSSNEYVSLVTYIPNSTNLVKSDAAIHEYLGLFWAKIRGYVA